MKIGFPFVSTNYLSRISRAIAQSLYRLSTGKRINSAVDDLAGLALATNFQTEALSIARASKNINEALGVLNTADSAISNQVDLLQQMREIAEQASSSTLSADDRSSLNSQLSDLLEQFKQNISYTEYQGQYLLDGSYGDRSLQVGSGFGNQIDLNLGVVGSDTTSVLSYLFNTSYLLEGSTSTTYEGLKTFTSAPDLSATTNSSDSLYADVNNDGNKDLLVSNRVDANISVYLSNGDGTFAAASLISAATPQALVAADFNGDSKTDLLVTDDSGSVLVKIGNGDGSFSDGPTVSVSNAPHSISVGDFNNDDKTDFAVGRNATGAVNIYLGNGDASFSQSATLSLAGDTQNIAVGDIDGDGNQDLAVANGTDNTVSIRLGNGDGTFTTTATLSGLSNAYDLKLADLNNDNQLDLVVTNYNSGTASIFTGNGDGQFAAGASLSTGFGGTSIAVGDLDGDGNTDIGISASSSNLLSLFNGNGDGSFAVISTSSYSSPGKLEFEDLTGEGVPDITLIENGLSQIKILKQDYSSSVVSVPDQILNLDMDDIDVSTSQNAIELETLIDSALDKLSAQQAKVSAQSNRLNFALAVSEASFESTQDAYQNLVGLDYADEIANYYENKNIQTSQLVALEAVSAQAEVLLNLLSYVRNFRAGDRF